MTWVIILKMLNLSQSLTFNVISVVCSNILYINKIFYTPHRQELPSKLSAK